MINRKLDPDTDLVEILSKPIFFRTEIYFIMILNINFSNIYNNTRYLSYKTAYPQRKDHVRTIRKHFMILRHFPRITALLKNF